MPHDHEETEHIYGHDWRMIGFSVDTPDGKRDVYWSPEEREYFNEGRGDITAPYVDEIDDYIEYDYDRERDQETRRRQTDLSDLYDVRIMYPREMYDEGEDTSDGPRFVRVGTPAGTVDVNLTDDERKVFAQNNNVMSDHLKKELKFVAYGQLADDNPRFKDMITQSSSITNNQLSRAIAEYRAREMVGPNFKKEMEYRGPEPIPNYQRRVGRGQAGMRR